MTDATATIIAAGIAAGISVISSILSGISIHVTRKGNKENNKSNEKISKEVQEAENRRNESQIDANIVWNARVEWIQNVRKVAVEFISECYNYIRNYNNDISEERLSIVEEKKLLLILYFGPDGSGNNQNKAENIFDKQTNNAKNALIVDLINEIYNQITAYGDACKEYSLSHIELVKCMNCEKNTTKQYLCKSNFDGFITDNGCKDRKATLQQQERYCYNIIHGVKKNLNTLSEAMRIYLKIEWNNAKNRGKD